MKHIVITGVSRGIGLKLLELSLKRGDKVCGVSRNTNDELKRIQLIYPNHFIFLNGDVNDPGLGKKMAHEIPWENVDILINNAGIYRPDTWADFEQTFVTNSIAPYFLTLDLFSKLKKSDSPRVAFITSLMGSIADNSSGGSISYRASKCALNMIVKCLSIEETWLTSLLFHPGWVKTDMGGTQAPVEAAESATKLLELIHSSEKNHTGTFRDFRGQSLPW